MANDWGGGITWHPGQEWRSRHGDWPTSTVYRGPSQITEFVVHHSGPQQTVPDPVEWMHAEYVAYVTGNNQNHETYVDLGYNAVVTATGDIWEVRKIDVQGGATLDHNTTAYAPCYLRTEPATDLAKLAFQKLCLWVSSQANHPLGEMVHSDTFATDCPGDDLRNWVHSGGLHAFAPPAPEPRGDDEMTIVIGPDGTQYLLGSGKPIYVPTTADSDLLVAGGAKRPTGRISQKFLDQISAAAK